MCLFTVKRDKIKITKSSTAQGQKPEKNLKCYCKTMLLKILVVENRCAEEDKVSVAETTDIFHGLHHHSYLLALCGLKLFIKRCLIQI